MAQEIQPLSWELGYPDPADPSAIKWTTAAVPGAVQLDIARGEGYGDYTVGENWRDYLWMEDETFLYRSRFAAPDLGPGERLHFFSGGIDYGFTVRFNGRDLLKQEGMFTPVRIDLTPLLEEENLLEVAISPVPKKHRERADRTQAAASVKPAVSYGWDWHPRLIPSGIWQETGLQVVPPVWVEDVRIAYDVSADLDTVRLRISVSGRGLDGCLVTWKLLDRNGGVADVRNGVSGELGTELEAELAHPKLWWPHDHGDPYLYRYSLEVDDRYGNRVGEEQGETGFRRVRLVMNEGGWDGPEGFPKTRNVAPAQLEVNGRRIFCKGTNWVNPEIFPGLITEERYRELLELAKSAHFNLLRVWGGGIVNKESFHRLCDRMGILVWQEFPLACNDYEDDPAYLSVLRQEARSIIHRVRRHPSLALWSGGNELFNSWSGMTDQSLAIRWLNSLCLEMDPNTPFIATSPLYGMGHGHYVFRDPETGMEVYEIMNRAQNTAYTEFGMPSPSPVEMLERIIPSGELWPPAPGTSWESHHAFDAWVGDTWLMPDLIRDYFGPAENLDSLVARGQLLQCEGYKAIYEEARRQKPYCSMALNWCYNEPWPTAANNSIINWPADPKPAYQAVSDACRPVMASARNDRFVWKRGEPFSTGLWILNDRFEPMAGGTVHARLKAGEETVELGRWEFGPAGPNENLEGPVVSGELPAGFPNRFLLELEVPGRPEYRSSYTFLAVDP